MKFNALGQNATPSRNLETFATPECITLITLDYDEMTSVCPVTGQPDLSMVKIEYAPGDTCIESKSLKLYFQTFRNEGVFCEALSAQIAQDIMSACNPIWCEVTVTQKRRGGIQIAATARGERI
jgi:7-cyano-7-deazaguanine reductase